MKVSITPTVLVIAPDSKLVESLRGAFGNQCHVVLCPTVEAGVARLQQQPHALRAVLIDFEQAGHDSASALSALRQRYSGVEVLSIRGNGLSRDLNGYADTPAPVAPKPLNGHHPAQPVVTKVSVEPATAEERPQDIISQTFLRDQAEALERANRFTATHTSSGVTVRGRILRVSSHFAVTEVLGPAPLIQPGWTADDATLHLANELAYQGGLRLTKAVSTTRSLICEWSLTQRWQGVSPSSSGCRLPGAQTLAPFFERMKLLDRISEVFKGIVSEMVQVLEEAQHCLDQIELNVAPDGFPNRADHLLFAARDLRDDLFPVFDQIFAKFEQASAEIPAASAVAYHSLIRQRLHPLMMEAPFIQHIYAKPLGFAGDFGALDYLVQEPLQGPNLYAMLLNGWLVSTSAGDAYRNRIELLVRELKSEARRRHAEGAPLRVLSIGCGAANEIVRFLAEEDLSNIVEFTLADFNEPTLNFARQRVDSTRREHWRMAQVSFAQTNVQSLILDQARMARKGLTELGPIVRSEAYDMVYCTGLFDYFSDRVCRRLLDAMASMLAPGGRLIVSNFAHANPIQHFMTYLLDWKLIHRSGDELMALAPAHLTDRTQEWSPAMAETYVLMRK